MRVFNLVVLMTMLALAIPAVASDNRNDHSNNQENYNNHATNNWNESNNNYVTNDKGDNYNSAEETYKKHKDSDNNHENYSNHDFHNHHEGSNNHESNNNHESYLTPSANSLLVATSGEVVLTFLSKSATYSNDLFLGGSSSSILNNQTAISGQKFSLGSFQAGTELTFNMLVNNTGYSFFNGIASNNPDNLIHSAYGSKHGNSVVVGFEDIFNGGDKDYNDLVFSLSNVVVGNSPVAAVPEPENYALLVAGLLMLGNVKRRKS